MTSSFAFDYRPGAIRFGFDATADIGSELDSRNLERALVVTGETVGRTDGVMDPVREAVGDRLVDVFAETTPEKYLATAVDAARVVERRDVGVLVAVGSGSSLDVAKVASALASHDRDPEAVARDAIDAGTVPVADDGAPVPVFAVPTTLAGADLSTVAGITLTLDTSVDVGDVPSGGATDRRLMPDALFYDPALFRHTPTGVLTASAMNGFDKAVEAIYSRHATPITDATASRAIRLCRSGFPTLAADEMDDGQLADAVAGVVLAQYGISEPGRYRASVIHAFGHGFSHDTDAHQGVVHGIVAPHVLRYLFSGADARRRLLADAFDVPTDGRSDDEIAEGVVDAVADVRDALGLPTRIRDLDDVERDDLPHVAEATLDDGLMEAGPEDFDPTLGGVRGVLEDAW